MRASSDSGLSVPVMFTFQPRNVDIDSKTELRARQSTKFGYETWRFLISEPDSFIHTMRSGSAYGRGCNSTALMTLNIAVFTPIPTASINTASTVNAGFFLSHLNP